MAINLTKKQLEVAKKAKCRLNFFGGAVRSGKTYLQILIFNNYVNTGPPGKLAIAAKTLETLRENILHPAQEILGDDLKFTDRGRRIEWGGRVIRGVGANDEKSCGKIQGDTFAGVMGDEVALWPESFFGMLVTRLSVPGAKGFLTYNPSSPFHWLKRKWIDRADEIDLFDGKFTLYDNDTLPDEYISALEKELTGHWYKRYILGLWTVASGLVYDMFVPEKMIVRSSRNWENYIVGVDYATSGPCVFMLIGYDNFHFHIVAERYFCPGDGITQKTDRQHAVDLADFLSGVSRVRGVYVDPSASSFKAEITQTQRRSGGRMFPVRDAISADNSVIPGIRHLAVLFQEGRLTAEPDCQHFSEEIAGYCWDEKAQLLGNDKPTKKDDHCMDAVRYAIHTHFPSGKVGRPRFHAVVREATAF